MRSRPRVDIRLTPGLVRPGQTVDVNVVFTSVSETPIDWIELRLEGWETVWIGTGESSHSFRHRHVGLVVRYKPGTFLPGQYPMRTRFPIPISAPPTYRGSRARVDYTLDLYVSIPWWPDVENSYIVPVGVQPIHVEPRPGVFTSAIGGPAGKDLYAELSLDSTLFTTGGVISGAISLSNVAHHNVRSVIGTFVQLERIVAAGRTETVRAAEYVVTLCPRAPDEGVAVPFRVRLPNKATPNCQGVSFAVEWIFEVTAITRWSRMGLLLIPIHMLPEPAASSASLPPQPSRWGTSIPTVGRARHAAIWNKVGSSFSMVLDPGELSLRATIGTVSVKISAEQQESGSAVVAHLTWPSLGIDLRVRPARFIDRLSRGGIERIPPAFKGQYTVHARHTTQFSAVLDDAMAELLASTGSVEFDDAGGMLISRVGIAEEAMLTMLISRVLTFARQFNATIQHLPPPPTLLEAAPAWIEFAGTHSGRLERGSLYVHDAVIHGERFSVGHRWTDDGVLDALLVTLHLQPSTEMLTEEALQRPLVRDALTDLRAVSIRPDTARNDRCSAAIVQLGPGEIILQIDSVVHDPGVLTPLFDRLGQLASALRGDRSAVPFR